ncbi:hypothetical protein AVEN_260569-1 [Araneus ventricosus]|uniref:Uncharacterized protein n=1 Tax=Araneus ventricosus TaxID=182803 RepID=A0A4Y2UVR0_ARAVE|nr:hypothetical protein AVEN_260569-1 [Araneus ventricosus]
MDNLCLKCGGLYFRMKRIPENLPNCCHNRNIVEQASVYPVEMKVDGWLMNYQVISKNNVKSSVLQWAHNLSVYRERSVLLQNSWPNLSQDLSSTPSWKQEVET